MTNTRVEFIIFADRTHLDKKRQSTFTLPAVREAVTAREGRKRLKNGELKFEKFVQVENLMNVCFFSISKHGKFIPRL